MPNQSSRPFTAGHEDFRAVPRANQALAAVRNRTRSATSNTVAPPVSAPWRSSLPPVRVAWSGADTVAATRDHCAPSLVRRPPTRSAAAYSLVSLYAIYVVILHLNLQSAPVRYSCSVGGSWESVSGCR